MTPRQAEVWEAYQKQGSYRLAAKSLGCHHSTVRDVVKAMERNGNVTWLANGVIPEHLRMAKTTVQLSADGVVEREWRRLEPRVEKLSDIVDGLCEKVKGKGKVPIRQSRKTDTDDYLFELDIYDAHVGMYADERETLDGNYD